MEAQSEDTSVRAVFELAWPVMVSMLSYTLMSVVDTLWVARLGMAPLAAVGLAAVMGFFSQSFGAGLMGGVRVLVAQATGAGDHVVARTMGWQALWMALPLGVLVSSVSLLPASMFYPLGASGAVAEYADQFFSIRVLGAPVVLINLAMTAWFQGRGDTRTPMKATLIGNGVNLTLDPLLIFGLWGLPALGVGGAALATVVSLMVQVAYLSWHIRPHLDLKSSSVDFELMKSSWNLGFPIGVRYSLQMGSFVIFSSMISWVGENHLAAHVIVLRICSISFMPGHAVGEACSVLVGHFVGAGRSNLARPVVRSALKLAVGIMVFWGVVFVVCPDQLLLPFGATIEVAGLAKDLLIVAAIFQVFDAVTMASQGGLNGAGDTRWVMVSSLSCAWFLKLPAGYLGAVVFGLGAVGAWLGFTLELFILSMLTWNRVRGGQWLRGAALDTSSR